MTDTALNDILKLLHDEDLIRLRHRARKYKMPVVAEIFSVELAAREQQEKEERKNKKKADVTAD